MSLVKRNTYGLEKTSGKSAAGTAMVVAGGGGLGLLLLAGLLPFITFPLLCVLLVVGGIALKL